MTAINQMGRYGDATAEIVENWWEFQVGQDGSSCRYCGNGFDLLTEMIRYETTEGKIDYACLECMADVFRRAQPAKETA